MASNERWLSVPGYPGYEVSDQGRVRSLDRVVMSRWGTPKPLRGRVLRLVKVGGGGEDGPRYWACSLYRDGKPKQTTIHTLVLEAFVGPRPTGAHGCHRDDDPNNNWLGNLYWGTPSQNGRDMVNNGGCAKSKITHCPQGHEYTSENTYFAPKTGHRLCRSCIKARNKGNANYTRTHCPQGHPYDEVNTYRTSSNRRMCRACVRNRSREYQRRKRAKDVVS